MGESCQRVRNLLWVLVRAWSLGTYALTGVAQVLPLGLSGIQTFLLGIATRQGVVTQSCIWALQLWAWPSTAEGGTSLPLAMYSTMGSGPCAGQLGAKGVSSTSRRSHKH